LREWLNNWNEYHAWQNAVRAVRAERNSGSARPRRGLRELKKSIEIKIKPGQNQTEFHRKGVEGIVECSSP
jgi:hypothetical protein